MRLYGRWQSRLTWTVVHRVIFIWKYKDVTGGYIVWIMCMVYQFMHSGMVLVGEDFLFKWGVVPFWPVSQTGLQRRIILSSNCISFFLVNIHDTACIPKNRGITLPADFTGFAFSEPVRLLQPTVLTISSSRESNGVSMCHPDYDARAPREPLKWSNDSICCQLREQT